MTLKIRVTADENSDLHHWIKLYFKVYYVLYMYVCMYTSDVWNGEEWKLLTWPANVTEHLNIMKQMHIDGSSSVCSAKCTNVAYSSASVNIVKISILIVSRQRHSSWNRPRAAALNALDVLKLSVKTLEWEPLRQLSACGREVNESFKLICEPIHWFADWFDQVFEQFASN